jgi:hopanoid biosynthesis associated RND transporter like protein HpnN
MSAERMPQADGSYLAQPFAAMTRLVLRFPVATVVIGVALALAAMLLTATRLGYKTSRLDLLNPKSDYNRLWIDYIQEFGAEDDAVIVVEGASREVVVPVLQELSQVLSREDQLFHAVLHQVDLSAIRSKGLHYLPVEELAGVEQFLTGLSPVLKGNWAPLSLGYMSAGLAARLEAELAKPNPAWGDATPAERELERLTTSLLGALEARAPYLSPWPVMPASVATLSELGSEYLLTNEGRLGFVLLRLAEKSDSFTSRSDATDALRALIAKSNARHPEVKIGLTGLPIMEDDEMRASQSSMLWASVISFVGVGLLFVAGFGGLRHAVLANLVLLLGMAWSFGYVTLAIGHLNILSVSFTVTLIGIGIDYGIHYISRYMELRNKRMDCGSALIETSRSISPAITAGAVTTAVAFFCAGFTNFTGVAELGIIAGGGLLLCAVSQLVVLPATVYLVDRTPWAHVMPNPLPVHKWIEPLMRTPRLMFLATAIGTCLVACGLGRLWYDNNLLNMQAHGLESVELERKLLAETRQSVWYALSIADSREELLERKARFLELPSVERTEEIVSMLPVGDEVKQPIIAGMGSMLASLPERPPLIPVDRPESLGRVLSQLQDTLVRSHRSPRTVRNLELIRDRLRRLAVSDCYRALSGFQQQMAGDMLSRLHALRTMANPEPPKLADLPPSLVHRFVGQHGRHLLKIYGKGNIWDMQALASFVHDVRTVDARVTGNPLQAHEASLEMKQSYEQAALCALVVIAVVLIFDLRSIRYAFLAALPLGLGMLQMFGLLGLLDIPLNPANLIALPLILGIGVDYGVHIIHDYREQTGRYRMSPSTAVAVMVDSLTTVVGFGSLMVASHQGLQSLGRVLSIGVSCCLFTSMIMLPALLTWMSWNRQPAEGKAKSNELGADGRPPLRRPAMRTAADLPMPSAMADEARVRESWASAAALARRLATSASTSESGATELQRPTRRADGLHPVVPRPHWLSRPQEEPALENPLRGQRDE